MDVNPLHLGSAGAAVTTTTGDSPPTTTSADCDGDNDQGTTAHSEIFECIDSFIRDNLDLFVGAFVGVALFVAIVYAGPFLFPLLFLGPAAPGIVALGLPLAGEGLVLLGLDLTAGAFWTFWVGVFGDFLFEEDLCSPAHCPTARAGALPFIRGYADVALPLPLPVSLPSERKLVGRCRRLRRKAAACARIARAERRYVAASSTTTSVLEALAVTDNRFTDARRHKFGRGEVKQIGVAKVLDLRLNEALDAQQRAGQALARELRRAGVRLRLTRAQFKRAAARLAKLKGIPKWVFPRLHQTLELDQSVLKRLFRQALRRLLGKPRSYDLAPLLSRPLAAPGLSQAYESLSFKEVVLIIDGIARHQGMTRQAANALYNDLAVAQRACAANQRRAPVNQFIADVRSKVRGPYSQFLQDAAQPLFGKHPYPNNIAPAAAFTFFPPNPKLSGTGSAAKVSFHDKSNDSRDGGSLACWQWDFGDPGSGAANTSLDPSPVHSYAKPGTYTVTLSVSDDDGFAQNQVSQQVTVGG